jgi:hypothetical protein
MKLAVAVEGSDLLRGEKGRCLLGAESEREDEEAGALTTPEPRRVGGGYSRNHYFTVMT